MLNGLLVLDGKTGIQYGETRRKLRGPIRIRRGKTNHSRDTLLQGERVPEWQRPPMVQPFRSVNKLNSELRIYHFGSVLPDGVPTPEQNLRHKAQSTEVSKDLAFYPTPAKTVKWMLDEGRRNASREQVCTGAERRGWCDRR